MTRSSQDDPKKEKKSDAGVPETWQGYLSEKQPPSAPTGRDGLSPNERDMLERRLRGETEEEEVREVVEEARRSKSEGVSFSGLVPFFLILILGMGGLFFYSWQYIKPAPYDVSKFGAADKTAQQVAEELVKEMTQGSGQPALELFVSDFDFLSIKSEVPRNKFLRTSLRRRYMAALESFAGGEFKAKFDKPLPAADQPGLAYIDYDREDLTTRQKEEKRLWLARISKGWRVAGFEE